MAYISDANLQQALRDLFQSADALKGWYTRADPGEPYENVLKSANLDAYNEIVGAMAARHFSAAQIADWDRGPEFNRYIGLYFLGLNGTALFEKRQLEMLAKMDRRAELLTVPFTIDGVLVTPEGDLPGGPNGPIGHGKMRTGCENFRKPRRIFPLGNCDPCW